jgi:predicted transcriptional regulator
MREKLKTTTQIRISSKLLEKVEEIAKSEGRTRTAVIEQAIADWLRFLREKLFSIEKQ